MIDPPSRDGATVAIMFVDAQRTPHYSEQASLDTIAAMRALMEKRRLDEIPEIKRTLERVPTQVPRPERPPAVRTRPEPMTPKPRPRRGRGGPEF